MEEEAYAEYAWLDLFGEVNICFALLLVVCYGSVRGVQHWVQSANRLLCAIRQTIVEPPYQRDRHSLAEKRLRARLLDPEHRGRSG